MKIHRINDPEQKLPDIQNGSNALFMEASYRKYNNEEYYSRIKSALKLVNDQAMCMRLDISFGAKDAENAESGILSEILSMKNIDEIRIYRYCKKNKLMAYIAPSSPSRIGFDLNRDESLLPLAESSERGVEPNAPTAEFIDAFARNLRESFDKIKKASDADAEKYSSRIKRLAEGIVFYRNDKKRIYVFTTPEEYDDISSLGIDIPRCVEDYMREYLSERRRISELPEISFLVRRRCCYKIISIKNTYDAWQGEYARCKELIRQGEDRLDYYFNVDCTAEDDVVTDLRYYLPLMDMLEQGGIRCELMLKLKDKSQFDRVKALFAIFPISCKCNYNSDKGSIRRANKTDFSASRIFPVMKIDDVSNAPELTLMYEIYKSWFEKLDDKYQGKCRDASNEDLQKFYKGDEENNIKTTKKRQLSGEITEYLRTRIFIKGDPHELSVKELLAKIIFMYMLYHLISGTKQMYGYKDEEAYIRYSYLDKALLDAESYADGLYQIIENACRYSDGHCAYFGMRIHVAGRMESMGRNLLDSIHTRNSLYQKYKDYGCINPSNKHCFRGNTYSDYIEFYVLDNAFEGNGIVPMYNKTAKKIGSVVKKIEEIINISENKYYSEQTIWEADHSEYYTKHYGLRWFTRVIVKNGGMFHVSSPDASDENGVAWHSVYYDYQALGKEKETTAKSEDGNDNEASDAEKWHKKGRAYLTDYNILIPLSYEYEEERNDGSSLNPQYLFGEDTDSDILKTRPLFKQIAFSPSGIYTKGQVTSDKDVAIEGVKKYICDEGGIALDDNASIYIDILSDNLNARDVEILAKALFKIIYEVAKNEKSSDREIRIAVDFKDKTSYVNDFVRIFSVFYDKLKENSYMKNTQIAVCTSGKDKREVNFIIAGVALQSAYNTARMYMYYNAESSMKYLHLLKYLIGNSSDNSQTSVSVFPFDLCLRGCEKDKEKSLFFARIDRLLTTDLTSNKYGCMISEVNIRLSSAIVVKNFYDAELLFHNIANTYRFAYMLACDIIGRIELCYSEQNEEIEKVICITAYENYSAMMLQQIAFWVRKWVKDKKYKLKVISALLTVEPYGASLQHTNEARMKINYLDSDLEGIGDASEIICHTIVPISTTMSTIGKVQKELRYHLRKDLDRKSISFKNDMNYVLVLVCPERIAEQSFDEPGDKDEIYRARFWLRSDKTSNIESHMVADLYEDPLSSESGSREAHQDVTCLLIAKTEWSKPEDIGKDKRKKPLLGVDKTSTIPRSVFGLDAYKRIVIFDAVRKSNDDRIKALRPKPKGLDAREYIKYAHLTREHNHFQFRLDTEKITVDLRSDIEEWAGKLAKDIPKDSFNIIIAPVNTANSVFVKLILDKVFTSSLRFMHLDINQTVAEEALTKFSYIFEELRELKKLNPKTAINFYYIDDSIVTGNTLQRAKKLMRMLIDRAGLSPGEELGSCLFRKVFFLINRCSYDTLNTIVDDPQSNVHAFIHFLFPSYNTTGEQCPGELVQNRYELLKKRSASVGLASDFAHLSEKHKRRTIVEYNKWIDNEIRTSRAYFSWMKWYLFNIVNRKRPNPKYKVSNKKYKLPESTKTIKLWDLICQDGSSTVRDFIENVYEKYDLEDHKQDHKHDQDDIYEIKKDIFKLMHGIIAERAYIRMETLNKAYKELIYHKISITEESNGEYQLAREDFEINMKEKIYGLLLGADDARAKDENIRARAVFEKYGQSYDDCERIMSYIKVISREHLSNYYHVKVAIIDVMGELLDALIEYYTANDAEKIGEKRFVSVDYLLCTTLIHRMAILQVQKVFSEDIYNKLVGEGEKDGVYIVMRKVFDNKKDCHPWAYLPSIDTMLSKYVTSIKTATMMTDNDAYCNMLLDTFNKGEKGDE